MIRDEADARAFVADRCDANAMERIDRLIELLVDENSRQNLVSTPSMDAIWKRHVADSAQLIDHVPRETPIAPWLDLGTGAGFPGLVIACMRPDWAVVLVESRKRRIEWLSTVLDALALECCTVAGARLELVAPFEAAAISARAFAPLGKLVTLARRFSTSDTIWLLPKGRSAAQEVHELPPDLRKLFHVEQSVTDADSGIVVGRGVEGRR